MVLCNSSVVENTSKFLNVSTVKCSTSTTGELQLKKSNKKLEGFATILETIVKESKSLYCPKSLEETALLRQWLEYCVCAANFSDSQPSVLNDFNKMLERRSYLIGNRPTVADIILYFVLYSVVDCITMQEKERLCHLSRWFSTIQHCPGLLENSSYKLITFSKNNLYC